MSKVIIVRGRVQGVTYRKYVKNIAEGFGYKGFVQNEKDGSVKIFLQDQDDNFDEFLSQIKIGNKFSRVDSLEISDITTAEQYDNFAIIKNNNIIFDQANSMKNLIKTILKTPEIIKQPLRHIALIPDGNRRWAKAKGLPNVIGHKVSSDFEHILDFTNVCTKYNVEFITIWAFSTENWKRPQEEVDYLMDLLIERVVEGKAILMKNNVKFLWLGNAEKLSKKILDNIKMLEETTKDNSGVTIQLALNYGGRDEIVSAVNEVIKTGVKKVTEEDLNAIINKTNIPNPDMIVRTGGENRLSGFMLYSCGYSELFFTKTLFPDFGPKELEELIKEYFHRTRNFGK